MGTTSNTSESTSKLKSVLLAGFCAIQALDCKTTIDGIELGLEEENPFMRKAYNAGGKAGIVAAKVCTTIPIAATHQEAPTALLIGLNLVMGAVALNNCRLIRKIKKDKEAESTSQPE